MIKKIQALIERITKVLGLSLGSVAGAVLVIWILIYFVGIVGRAFFGFSWLFIEEFTAYYNMLLGCFGFVWSVHQGAHIRVTLIFDRLPQRVQHILGIIASAVYTWWAVILLQQMYAWFEKALRTGSTSSGTGFPLWVPYLISVIGFAALIIGCFLLFTQLLLREFSPPEEEKVLTEEEKIEEMERQSAL